MSFTDQVKNRFRQLFNADSDVKNLSEQSTTEENQHQEQVQEAVTEVLETPVEIQSPVPENNEEPETGLEAPTLVLLNGAFASFLEANPDPAIQLDAEGNYQFIDEEDPEKSYQMDTGQMLSYMLNSFADLSTSYKSALDSIQDLTDRLNARPTIPADVSDPQVKVDLNTPDPDNTGQQILANIPHDLKAKLKRNP